MITSARLRGAEAGADLSGLDVDDTGDDWIHVAVPGDVRAALVAAGKLADPDCDPTDQGSAWVDDLEWWYRFELPAIAGLSDEETVVLRFEGIDTFATLFVDGAEAARSQNMFRVVEIDVTAVVAAPGRHVVAVRIERPWARLGLTRGGEFDDRRAGPRVRVRKAQFGYGWDFAPNQPSIGLWRPVTLMRRRRSWIESVRFQTLRLDGTTATVAIDTFVGGGDATAAITLTAPDGQVVFRGDAPTRGGVARAVAVIDDAQLWWPHGLGEAALHALRVAVGDDTHTARVGIRTIALDQSANPDDLGHRFFRFVANGRPFFAKGANWVPCDTAVGTVTAAQYRPLLAAARDAHMNMVRVWGGGVYEHDAFYDLCDELGLLVWQEFMFACAVYPDDDAAFLDDIRAEATDQVRRLRSHACLALWCGNNEVEAIAMINDPALERSPGARIFYCVLPEVVAAEDGVLGYVPTSPMLGNGPDDADRHNWDVWHALAARQAAGLALDTEGAWFVVGEPLEVGSAAAEAMADGMAADQYLTDTSRFPSEFGLRSMPARPTLAQWIEPDHLRFDDPQIVLRNRDILGPTNKIELAVSRFAGQIHTLDDFIDLGQFTQAEGLKLGCEHFRRRWPHCGGTLIWQLNDCWPAPTWSLIDHAARPKAALYYAARFYAPVLPSLVAEPDGGASLWLVNDTDATVRDTLTVRLHRFAGDDVWVQRVDATVPPSSSRCVATWAASKVNAGTDRALLVHGRVGANRLFFAPPNNLERQAPEVAATCVRHDDGRVAVTLTARGYALFAHVLAQDPTVRFDDNYVDIASGEVRTLTTLGPAALEDLSVRWL